MAGPEPIKLLVGVSEFEPLVGGIATLTGTLLEDLRHRDQLQVTLWAPTGTRVPTGITLLPTLERHTSLSKRFWTELKNGRTLARHLRTGHYDAVLFMDAAARCYGLPGVVPSLPTVIYVHGTEVVPSSFSGELLSGRVTLQRRAMLRAEKILANSTATAKFVQELNFTKPIHTVYPCFDPARTGAPDAAPRANRPSDQPFTFLTVARLVERKGHTQVLDLLAQLLPLRPNFRYVIVGDGPYRATLEQYAHKLGLSDRVDFRGYCALDDLPGIYQDADLFIMLPTRAAGIEGFGLTYVEAALAGVPAVGTAHGGVSEAVLDGETGLLVADGDVATALNRVQALMDDPQRREQLGAAAKARALATFTPAHFADQILHFIQAARAAAPNNDSPTARP